MKGFSRCLINIFGEKTIEITKHVSPFVIGISYVVMLYSMYKFLDSGLITTILLILITSTTFAENVPYMLEYHKDSLCRQCGKRFACEEIKEPTINEISTAEEYTVIGIRHWKCKFCGHVDIREGPENIVAEKGRYESRNYLKKIECKNCGEKNVIEEFRRSDIKKNEREGKSTIRNYYKCNHCGYIDIRVSEKEI